jgi:hypothetical protein
MLFQNLVESLGHYYQPIQRPVGKENEGQCISRQLHELLDEKEAKQSVAESAECNSEARKIGSLSE